MTWSEVLANIPPKATEGDVCTQFVPYLLEALGFSQTERLSECWTDHALDIRSTVVPSKFTVKSDRSGKTYHILDVIPADVGMEFFTTI